MLPPLACTVRDCGLLLERHNRTYRCARGHAYDIARAGYVNLLQPQDRRSASPGDSKSAIEARARLLAAGVGRTIIDRLAERASNLLAEAERAVVVDLGAGSGAMLNALAELGPIVGMGVDISTAAAEHAARHFPTLTWAVANADRGVPAIDVSVDLVLSLHGRRNVADCARALTRGGHLLVAVPAADDLKELRQRVLGEAVTRDRADRLIAEHQPFFTLQDRSVVRELHTLDAAAIGDLLQGTYRGARAREADRARALDSLEVTLSSELLLLEKSADFADHAD